MGPSVQLGHVVITPAHGQFLPSCPSSGRGRRQWDAAVEMHLSLEPLQGEICVWWLSVNTQFPEEQVG